MTVRFQAQFGWRNQGHKARTCIDVGFWRFLAVAKTSLRKVIC